MAGAAGRRAGAQTGARAEDRHVTRGAGCLSVFEVSMAGGGCLSVFEVSMAGGGCLRGFEESME